MGGKAQLDRKITLLWLVLGAGVALVCVPARATPIPPDVRKAIRQQHPAPMHYLPARAGWNGPEVSSAASAVNPTLETYGPAASAQAARAELVATAIPDPRIAIIVAVVIMAWRFARYWRQERCPASRSITPGGPDAGDSTPKAA